MGLDTVVANAVKTAFSIVKDFLTTATVYETLPDPVYNDATGTYTEVILEDSDIQILLTEYEGQEVVEKFNFQTDQLAVVEKRLMVNTSAPTHFGIEGIRWDVISPMRVPGDSVRMFHVRNTGQAIV